MRRITRDLDNGRVIDDITIEGEMGARVLHLRLPVGIENIGTTLVYRQTPGHPDPGKLVSEVPEVPEDVPLDKEPEEDARLIDLGMKRGLDEPATRRSASKSHEHLACGALMASPSGTIKLNVP